MPGIREYFRELRNKIILNKKKLYRIYISNSKPMINKTDGSINYDDPTIIVNNNDNSDLLG